jgi:hypothetical protein
MTTAEIDLIIDQISKTLPGGAASEAQESIDRAILLSQSPECIDFAFEPDAKDGGAWTEQPQEAVIWPEYRLVIDGEKKSITALHDNKPISWDMPSFACLLSWRAELDKPVKNLDAGFKRYSREGMILRVLTERREKAEKAQYRIKWAKNIYGDHILTNEAGVKYTVFLRDFANETGYSNSVDARYNKLGTTKHIMFAFAALKADKKLYKGMKNSSLTLKQKQGLTIL